MPPVSSRAGAHANLLGQFRLFLNLEYCFYDDVGDRTTPDDHVVLRTMFFATFRDFLGEETR